jgi:hypothetical protein
VAWLAATEVTLATTPLATLAAIVRALVAAIATIAAGLLPLLLLLLCLLPEVGKGCTGIVVVTHLVMLPVASLATAIA